jgi:CubicO group peptidase (beta-lactamase class C family)
VPIEDLRAYVSERLELQAFPGLSLAITDRHGILASESFGYADLAARQPVAPTTLFEIGSIGKTFTSVALLQLREEGLIDLDAPVTRYLPWFEVRSEHDPITLHHLLTHTAGIVTGPDLSSDSRFDVWALRESETGSPPGKRFHYSNVGYRVIGCVLEDVTGKPYAEIVGERILEPLGLDAAEAAITSETRKRLAVGYERWYDDRPARRRDPFVPAPWVETGTADGAQATTAEDLAAFLRVFLNEGEPLLSAESFGLMGRPVTARNNDWSYGYGLMVGKQDGRSLVGHGGSMPGFSSTMLGDLTAGIGVAVLVNGPDEGDLTEEVARVALDLYRDSKRPPELPDLLAVENAADFAGSYSGARELTLVADGGRLALEHAGARVPLEPRGDDRFLVDHPDFALYLLVFERVNGAVVAAWHGEDVYRREDLVAPPSDEPPPEWRAYTGHYLAYNPWLSNFRILLRRDRLVLAWPWGPQDALAPLDGGSFRVGEEEWSPERLGFDAVVDGKALRANLSGCDYYRVTAP